MLCNLFLVVFEDRAQPLYAFKHSGNFICLYFPFWWFSKAELNHCMHWHSENLICLLLPLLRFCRKNSKLYNCPELGFEGLNSKNDLSWFQPLFRTHLEQCVLKSVKRPFDLLSDNILCVSMPKLTSVVHLCVCVAPSGGGVVSVSSCLSWPADIINLPLLP